MIFLFYMMIIIFLIKKNAALLSCERRRMAGLNMTAIIYYFSLTCIQPPIRANAAAKACAAPATRAAPTSKVQ